MRSIIPDKIRQVDSIVEVALTFIETYSIGLLRPSIIGEVGLTVS
jgi:hypothetical protein